MFGFFIGVMYVFGIVDFYIVNREVRLVGPANMLIKKFLLILSNCNYHLPKEISSFGNFFSEQHPLPILRKPQMEDK